MSFRQGIRKLPETTPVRSDVPIELAEEGVNYFEDQPDELIWPAVPSTFGLDIPMSVITGEE